MLRRMCHISIRLNTRYAAVVHCQTMLEKRKTAPWMWSSPQALRRLVINQASVAFDCQIPCWKRGGNAVQP
jgi:hypothetical protein